MSDALTYIPLLDGDETLSGYRFRVGGPSGEEGLATTAAGAPEDVVTLDQHFVTSVAYTREASGKMSWFAGLLKGDAEGKSVGVVQEAKMYTVREIEGQRVEIGVAVQLKIEATTFKSSVQVTVPNIAAEAQLGLSRAQMEISVRGYCGMLGEMLPAPSGVNLASYAHYIEAFAKLQKLVFGPSGQAHFSPVVLGRVIRGEAGAA
ncbi:hypothetical protein [Ruegeria sp. HKCCD8929]|uniref:hypothetical protein n=1 Tax=Ruegeria sp. HKCCD8929 TaxID=2683006 RepID=UPI001488C671|nr:hypothetical protein [Ruegeria sp. HKCCD8929]